MNRNYRNIFEQWYVKEDPWHTKSSFREKYRLSICFKMIPQRRYKRVLDVGCGEGYFTRKLLGLAEEVYFVDVARSPIKHALKNVPQTYFTQTQFMVGDIRALPFPRDFFDLVICLEVLYYLPVSQRNVALESVHGLLKKNGLCLLSVQTNYKTPFRKGHLNIFTRFPYFTYKQTINMLGKKFKILKVVPTGSVIPAMTPIDHALWTNLSKIYLDAWASGIATLAIKQ